MRKLLPKLADCDIWKTLNIVAYHTVPYCMDCVVPHCIALYNSKENHGMEDTKLAGGRSTPIEMSAHPPKLYHTVPYCMYRIMTHCIALYNSEANHMIGRLPNCLGGDQLRLKCLHIHETPLEGHIQPGPIWGLSVKRLYLHFLQQMKSFVGSSRHQLERLISSNC